MHTIRRAYCLMGNKDFVMENFSPFLRMREHLASRISVAASRIHPFTIFISCIGILLAYLTGIYASGSIHSASRWMGAMLACTSVITVLQMPSYKESLRPSIMRVVGTFLGAVIAYIYLRLLPFSVVGMLCAVFALEALCMLLDIYKYGRIATITMVIILLVKQMSPNSDPMLNCALRFFESAVGVGVGLGVRWAIERWNAWRERLLHMGQSDNGQPMEMESMPLRWGHLRVVIATSLGQLTGGALSTLVGVVLPLMQVVGQHHLGALMQGVLGSMSLVGIMFGSVLIGKWSDRRGYLHYLRLSPALILLGAIITILFDHIAALALGLFVMGFGVGGGYSLDSDYISEIMPRRWRIFMVGLAKASSAIGNVVMAFVCFYILKNWSATNQWNGLFLLVAILSIIMLLSYIRFAESPAWLIAQGRNEQAEHAIRYLLGNDVKMSPPSPRTTARPTWQEVFRPDNLPRAIFSGIPWACEGFGVYGVGVFMPPLIMAMGFSKAGSGIGHLTSSVELSAYVNIFVAAGFAIGLTMLRRWNYVQQQAWGFIFATLGLGLLIAAYTLHWQAWIMILGLILFEIFINCGPHLITFILPSQIYPIADRGVGAGTAAACGKAGATAGVFLMPLLIKWGGITLALGVTALLQLIGAVITLHYGNKITPPLNK